MANCPSCRSVSSAICPSGNSSGDTDEAGHAFQSEAGHPFQFEADQGSDVMSARGCAFPRVILMMFAFRGLVKGMVLVGVIVGAVSPTAKANTGSRKLWTVK